MTRLLIKGFFLSVGLLFVAGIALASATWAAPTQAHQIAQTNIMLETDHAPANSLADSPANSPADNMIGMHHPRGYFAGSYRLNTPARPGFWIAAGFTGLIGVALLITLVLFRPGSQG